MTVYVKTVLDGDKIITKQ